MVQGSLYNSGSRMFRPVVGILNSQMQKCILLAMLRESSGSCDAYFGKLINENLYPDYDPFRVFFNIHRTFS